MTVLVTGAGGNVGSAVVDGLLARGVEIRLADRLPEGLSQRFDGVASVRLDFTDPATFDDAVRGCDGLFLIRPPAIARVGPTLNAFVDRAVAAGVGHVVFSSVAGAEGNRIVPHHRVERHVMATGVGWTMLRPGFFAQNLETAYLADVQDDDRLYVPAGDGLVAFVDTVDVGAVAAAALADPATHVGAAHHLTGPAAISFHDLAVLLTDIIGRPIRYEPATVLGYAAHLRRRGLVPAQVAVQTLLHVGLRGGDAEDVTTDVADVLGRPATPIESYVARRADRFSRGGESA